MHYFSGKGCSESLESMHYCIGILMFAIKNVPKQQTGVRNVERLELKHIAPGNIIAHIHTRPRNVPDVDILKNK